MINPQRLRCNIYIDMATSTKVCLVLAYNGVATFNTIQQHRSNECFHLFTMQLICIFRPIYCTEINHI